VLKQKNSIQRRDEVSGWMGRIFSNRSSEVDAASPHR